MSSSEERSFSISVPDSELDFLKKKLELARFPDELEGAGWDYGVPLPHIKRLVEHWQNGFDWRKSENALNSLPMFTRDIDVEGFGTLNIHYVHQKSDVAAAIPLLFVHGCRWSGHISLVVFHCSPCDCRAWVHHRGQEAPAASNGWRTRLSKLSRCCAESTWIWFLPGTKQARIQGPSVCGGKSV